MTFTENLAVWLFVVVFILAIFHFVYENAILPDIRQQIGFKLLSLRDQLRYLKISGANIDSEAFKILDQGITRQIDNLPGIKLSVLMLVGRYYKNDAEFRMSVDRTVKILNDCENAEFQKIRSEANNLVVHSAMMNGAVFMIPVLLPIAVLSLINKWLMSKMLDIISSRLKWKRRGSYLLVVPKTAIENIGHTPKHAI